MKKEILALMVICLVLAFSASNARAEAVSTSQARIDWTSLTITGDITWRHKASESYAYAEDATGSEDFEGVPWGGWVDTDAFASVSGAYGDAYTNGAYLYEGVYASANKTTTIWANSEAYARRWGDFDANSNGWVEFSADYELSQDLRTNYVGESAYGLAEAVLLLVNVGGLFPGDDDTKELVNTVWDGGFMTDSDAGTLTVAVWFNAGEPGYFRATVDNNAEVETPEPTTIALLGLGALGLLRSSRRRREP